MTINPLVSVVIPTYNRASVVVRAIDSVLDQTYPNVELIVVDDGSVDNTQEILAGYGSRIRVLSQQNAGPSIARNRGIAVANGEIIAFLDSDDVWLPPKLERQVEALQRAGGSVPCCLSNCTTLRPDGSRSSTFAVAKTTPPCPVGLWTNPAEVLMTRFVIFTQAAAVRREYLERVGPFDENLPFFCEDHELALRLALGGPWAVIRDELVICNAGGPGSLGEQALAEEVRLRKDLVYMHTRIEAMVAAGSGRRLRRLARRELERARRELLAARLSAAGGPAATLLSRILRVSERLRRSVYRRSSCYPKVVVTPLD